jgi:hypothetical protein
VSGEKCFFQGFFWTAVNKHGRPTGGSHPLLVRKPGPFFTSSHEDRGRRVCRVRVTIEEVNPETEVPL